MEDDLAKGKSIINQLVAWDLLLETRIKLQKLLIIANKLPQHDVSHALNSLDNEQLNLARGNAILELKRLSKRLRALMRLFNPHKSLTLQESSKTEESEIESENDENDDREEDQPAGKKTKVADFTHQDLVSARNRVMEYWYQKTRYTNVGKVNKNNLEGFEESVVRTIERILENRQRLVERTRTKRSIYEIVGKSGRRNDKSPVEDEEEEEGDAEEGKDAEIFDDDDFYHQLLREIIESKAANVSDPIALSKKWLEIQKLRSKMKKKVDTKTTKGRKIKYNVHSKLLNFMAPREANLETFQASDELFQSLFGARKSS